jgi:glucose/arabinose dehydrogenase
MRRHGYTMMLAAITLLSAAPASAQQTDQQWLAECERQAERSDRAVHCEVRLSTVPLAAAGLAVDAGPNGGIIVRGGNVRVAEVSARLQVQAESDAAAAALARQVRVLGGTGSLRSEGPERSGAESWSVTYYVTVPHQTNLDLATVNGPASVADVSGQIRIETRNGPLRLEHLAGDVHARTRNGPLTVVLDGQQWDGGGLDAETVNGPVRLTVPHDYSATLEFGTDNGPMSLASALPITVTGDLRGRFTTMLGEGGNRVRVVTSNGPFSVHRP